MPISHQKNISSVLNLVDDMQKKHGVDSILDIGTGFGKYGMLLRERLDIRFLRYHKKDWLTIIDGVEPFEDYINPIHLHVYNDIFKYKIEKLIGWLDRYDVIIMIDVLEHLSKRVGKRVLRKIYNKTRKLLILSFPTHPGSYRPGAVTTNWDNKLEIHKSLWSEEEVASIIGPVKHHKSTICCKSKIV